MSKTELVELARNDIAHATNANELELVKSRYLGKKSVLEHDIRALKDLPLVQKKAAGQRANDQKKTILALIIEKSAKLEKSQEFAPIDLSLPAKNADQTGHLHPSSRILAEVYEVFSQLGYGIVDSGEIETDWYNFEALNMPQQHSARDMQDTFYLKQQHDGRPLVPRTHTSGMQIRFLEANEPPVKIIVPGKVYRNEDEDKTHLWSFTQVEGLAVGEGVSLANLKGTLEYFVKAILGQESKIRLRPSYFPYTEPSVEVDAWYEGEWVEMLGAGMVHPEVLAKCGIDPEKYSGFAFGVGVERLAYVKYKMGDLRYSWRPNLNFLEAF